MKRQEEAEEKLVSSQLNCNSDLESNDGQFSVGDNNSQQSVGYGYDHNLNHHHSHLSYDCSEALSSPG